MAKKNTTKKESQPERISYTPELGEAICTAIANSRKGLVHICKENSEFPCRKTIHEWVIKHKDFGDNYVRAKAMQAELFVEEMIDIADDGTNDTQITDDGKVITDHDVISRSRLRVDTRKWLASKLAPKIYGEKITAEHTGKDGKDLPTSIKVEFIKKR